MTSVHTCFGACICLILQFAYLAYCCFCAMFFSVSHLSIVRIFCFLYYMPGVYLKSPMPCLRCDYCLLPYRLKYRWLKMTKLLKNFITFNRRNILADEINHRRKFLTDEVFHQNLIF